jgi:hypothetical protein
MTVEKLSISLDEEAAAAARAAADAEGLTLSAWLSRAAVRAAALEEGLRGVREWESQAGRLSARERREADEVLDRHGVGRA